MLYEVITGIDTIRIDGERFFKQGDCLQGSLRHERMSSVSMQRVDLFFPTNQTAAPPVQDEVRGLLQADGEGGEDGSKCHGNQH